MEKIKLLLFLFLLTLASPFAQAQQELDVLQKDWVHFSDASNSLYKHFASQAYELLEERRVKVSKLNSLEDWKSRQEEIKSTFTKVLGSFPEKTKLNAQVIRTVKKEGYRVEHIVFESQPGFYVTSSLFIPDGTKGKSPAVIYCSGHSENGYRVDTYQHVILNLVKKGFIVFAFDPVGQGERLEYLDEEKGTSLLGGPTKEHSYPGAQTFVSGSSEAYYMIWDGIRAVDYLLTRKEIDPARIGITGRSGGGTQSSYIAALDERIYAAAPENYLTNFTRLFETEGPQDAEQNFYQGIAEGLDHADLLEVRAPKPALMITTTRDIFNIQGARETAEEVSRIYAAYGKEAAFSMVEDDAGHASTLKNREAMYAFFQKHLNNPGDSKDQEVTLLTVEEIQVTPTGQIASFYKGETVYALNKKTTEKQMEAWQSSVNENATAIRDAVNKARQLSGYIAPREIGEPAMTGRIQRDGYVIEKYYIQGEGQYIIPYLLMVPEISNGKAVIYIDPSGKSSEASAGGEIEKLVKDGFMVLAPDLIGIGEVGPRQPYGDSVFQGSSYNVWFASLLVGRSIVGVQAGDVVRLALLLNGQLGAKEIYGIALREMAPVLLHAASFDPIISRVALIDPLVSYQSLVTSRFYSPKLIHSAVPAALTGYDLPLLAASLVPRKLLLVNVLDASGNPVDLKSADQNISLFTKRYENSNIKNGLQMINNKGTGDYLKEWLK